MTTKLDPNLIVASGTPSSSTYLRGDGSWAPLVLPPIWVTQAGSIAISNEQVSFTTNLIAADPAGLSLTYSIVSGALPSGLTMDNSGVITGTVTRVFSNTVSSFTVSVTNGSQAKQRAFSITVNNNINEAPNWSTAAGSIGAVNMGSVFNYNLSAVDPNGDAVTYLLVSGSLPTGLSMNSSGVITGTAATVGVTTVSTFTVRAVDIYATFVERTFSITVNSTTYYVTNSLRIDHGNKVFTRTPSINGNQRIWTLSMWVKMDVSTNYDRGILLHCSSPSTCIEFSDDAGNFAYGTGKAYALSIYQSSTPQCQLETAMQFRDPSAWYHVVVSMNTTATICNTYINGVLQTYSGHTTQPTLNFDGGINSTQLQSLFNYSTSAQTAYSFGGYVADVYLIDGAALTPTSFGKFDSNLNWVPIAYVGTYGTNGFHLEFKNSANLGLDTSGNGNNWTVNGFTSADQMIDTPTNNYCTLNPLDSSINGTPLTNGNLTQPDYTAAGGGKFNSIATMGVTSGKWYWECKLTSRSQTGCIAGICGPGGDVRNTRDIYGYYESGGQKMAMVAGASSWATYAAYGSAWNTGVVLGVAFDADAGTLAFYLGGVSLGVAFTNIPMLHPWFPCSVDGGGQDGMTYNFGQSSFAYTPPTGFVSLCTNNLPAVAITAPSNYFNPVLWTGNSTNRSITVGFQPDFTWIKTRSTGTNHALFDSVRLAPKMLSSELATGDVLTNTTSLTSFDVNGFSLGTDAGNYVNTTGLTYVGWNWKKGSTPGFDIVTYAGNGSNRTIPHSVGATPKMIMVKDRTASANWHVYHVSCGFTGDLMLNQTSVGGPDSTLWNNTPPTSSVFSLGTSPGTNANGDNYVAYLWAEVPGFSKFGSYTGNSNNDGTFVYCGFKPRFIMVRDYNAGGSGNWYMMDSARNAYNEMNFSLRANSSILEQTINGQGPLVDFVSNGFKFRGYNEGNQTITHIYCAFAELPFGGSNVSPTTAR